MTCLKIVATLFSDAATSQSLSFCGVSITSEPLGVIFSELSFGGVL